jgi:carboxypeptidase C (cathepsin A)
MLIALASLFLAPAAPAQDVRNSTPPPPAAGAEPHKDAEKETPVPPEKPVATHHELAIGGKTLKYTATAGTLIIRDEEDKPYGSIFYVAYTLDGAEPQSRPVSFLYNGGPGSATLWLHMGSFSPVRVETDSPNPTAGPPFKLIPNQYSLLDTTDLVFIDAPLTGYSRAVGKATAKDFAGVVLISSILNYNIRAGGYDTLYVANLPSYAAAAWYFNKIPNKPASLADWVEQARIFASGPYAQALFAGHTLPAKQLDTVAKEVSRLTGLSVDYVKESNLRISPTRFRKEVLRQDRRTLGRYDMRFEGVDLDAAGEAPSYDASDAGISGAFVGALHDYLERELKYESTDAYRPSAETISQWDWKHKPTSGGPGMVGGEQTQPYVAADLASAMRKNPHLKVFSANGYFDLATPFFATEYDLSHMNLEPGLRSNVQFGYYPSGHMIYLNVESLHQLKDDLAGFIAKAEQ